MLLMLVACDSGVPPPPPNTGVYAPEINPSPQYFMTIKGHMAPKLIQNHQLIFIADYYTDNPACEYTISSIEGVSSSRKQSLILPAQVNNFGFYQIKIPLDQYKNGVCQWSLFSIGFKLNNTNLNFLNVIAFFKKNSKNKTYHIHDKLFCINNICNRLTSPYLDTEYFLSTNTNYTFQLDINGK
jgi:hypothetical protein